MRERLMVWLDMTKPEERELVKQADNLKQNRQFSQVVRDGLAIIPALLAGNPDPLFERFPFVIDMVLARFAPPAQVAPPANTDSDGSGGRGDDIRQQLARMEQLLIQQGMNPNPQEPPRLNSPAPREGAYMADDIELEIKQATTSADNNSTWNFLIAGALNIYGNVDSLAPEIVAYGVRTGRIPAGMAGKKTPASAAVSGNPKAMDVPQFAVPDFEDDFDLEIGIS